MKIRWKFNKVKALLDSDGQWVYKANILKGMAYTFYENLFKEEGISQSMQRL